MRSLDVRVMIETEYGWLSVNDGENYRIANDAFADRKINMRTQDIKAPYVEGTFVVNAVRENVQENLSVWVYGHDHQELAMNVQALVDAVARLSYEIYVEIDGRCEVWSCIPADVSISTTHEYHHNRMAKVVAQISRQPTVKRVGDATYILIDPVTVPAEPSET